MKPFNLEQARQGKPVQTRDGLEVKILIFDLNHETYKIGGVFDNRDLATWTNEGEFKAGDDTGLDLFMKSGKREGWVNVSYGLLPEDRQAKSIFATEEEALQRAGLNPTYITTVKVEWEE